ncbi:MAG: sn-glycerol-1-phosphate dehydrogenase [Halanaerobiaceae bacterium]
MSLEIDYEKDKLVISELKCDCGLKHKRPEMDVYIGNGIMEKASGYIKRKISGNSLMLVTDNIIYDLYGEEVINLLETGGYNVKVCLLEREEKLVPDDTAVGEALLALDDKIDFLVALGSGSINDITRYVAYTTGRVFVSIGTAPSMDGYTSVISPLIYGNLKVNKKADHPAVLICDLEIMKRAPYKMLLAGLGDVLGKYIARADWTLGKIVNNEQYCPACIEIVKQAVNKCMDNIDGIINRTDRGIRSLIEALILSGLTILIIGFTRPVASNEHNMSHYWKMMKLSKDEKAPSHGISVGVATGYVLKFYEEFFKLDFNKIHLETISSNRDEPETRNEKILKAYGNKLGKLILNENPDEYLTWEEQSRRINVLTTRQEQIKEELSFLPNWEYIINMYKDIGMSLTAQEIHINRELLKNALLYAKDYRDRYTVFKSANELGVLEELVERTMKQYDEINS